MKNVCAINLRSSTFDVVCVTRSGARAVLGDCSRKTILRAFSTVFVLPRAVYFATALILYALLLCVAVSVTVNTRSPVSQRRLFSDGIWKMP